MCGALWRPEALEEPERPRPATSSFDRGIGMRDIHRRNQLERKHGQPATVDPTTFFPSSANSPAAATAAAAAATPKQPPLDVQILLGADTVDGGPIRAGWFDADDEWDDLFRDIATGAAIGTTLPSPAAAAASTAGSSAIGGRMYAADHDQASSSSRPMFAEVGKLSEVAASATGGEGVEAPVAPGGDGAGYSCFGAGNDGAGGGAPAHNGSGTANMAFLDEGFHGLFGPIGGKDCIAEYFSERAGRMPAAGPVEAAATTRSVEVEETLQGGGSSNAGGAVTVAQGEEGGSTLLGTNAAFTREVPGAGSEVMRSGGGGSSGLSTPTSENSSRWLSPAVVSDSEMSEAVSAVMGGEASESGSTDEVDVGVFTGFWGGEKRAGGAAVPSEGGEGFDAPLSGTDAVFTREVPGAGSGGVLGGGSSNNGGGGSPGLSTPTSEDSGRWLSPAVVSDFEMSEAVSAAIGGEASESGSTDEVDVGVFTGSWGGEDCTGGAAVPAEGGEGFDAPLSGTGTVFTREVLGAESVAVPGAWTEIALGGSGGGGGSGKSRLSTPASEDGVNDISLTDSLEWLLAVNTHPEMPEAWVAVEEGGVVEADSSDEFIEVAAPLEDSATSGAVATAPVEQPGNTVSRTGTKEVEPEVRPASATSGDVGGKGDAASPPGTTIPTSSTSSWLGSAAGLLRAATTVIVAAFSTGDGSRKQTVRGWRSTLGGAPHLEDSPVAFPCRRKRRGGLRVRHKRSPAAQGLFSSGGPWVDRDDTTPWIPPPKRHVWMESLTPCA
eukprot:g10047.t1